MYSISSQLHAAQQQRAAAAPLAVEEFHTSTGCVHQQTQQQRRCQQEKTTSVTTHPSHSMEPSTTTDLSAAVLPKPGNGGGSKARGGWGPLRLLPRVPLPGIPVPRLPLPGLRRAGSRSGNNNSTAAAASLTLSATDAGLAAATAGGGSSALSAAAAPPPRPKQQLKPASDVLAGAMARALSQSTIHPLDTLKVRMQASLHLPKAPPAAGAGAASGATAVRGLSKFGQLVPPPVGGAGSGPGANLAVMGAGLASLYKGVVGAASGAGIAIGAYFACYGVASNLLVTHSTLSPSAVAFVAGGAAAAGSSVVKVPLAVCIRSVQAGVYPNVFAAASAITGKAGARGLFTGACGWVGGCSWAGLFSAAAYYVKQALACSRHRHSLPPPPLLPCTGFFPTLLEDVPDMAVKFAAYESMRQLHARMINGRTATPQVSRELQRACV